MDGNRCQRQKLTLTLTPTRKCATRSSGHGLYQRSVANRRVRRSEFILMYMSAAGTAAMWVGGNGVQVFANASVCTATSSAPSRCVHSRKRSSIMSPLSAYAYPSVRMLVLKCACMISSMHIECAKRLLQPDIRAHIVRTRLAQWMWH